jgi:hypothetical protein
MPEKEKKHSGFCWISAEKHVGVFPTCGARSAFLLLYFLNQKAVPAEKNGPGSRFSPDDGIGPSNKSCGAMAKIRGKI